MSVPRLNTCSTTAIALAAACGNRLAAVRAELPAAALSALRDADPAAVPALLGRGSGLTPVGDDVLCGWVATRHSISTPSVPLIRSIEANAVPSTTSLSATLLDRACAGDVIPAFRRLLLSLRAPTAAAPAIRDAVDALFAVGHTSGAGLLLGCSLALGDRADQPATVPSYADVRRGR
ncbi:oxamate carbamoyltransferase subunit AllH family protein [Solicola gregarius]